MATHSYIFEQEAVPIQAQQACRHAIDAPDTEKHCNDGFIYVANRDAWNTLFVNAQDARKKLDTLIALLGKAL